MTLPVCVGRFYPFIFPRVPLRKRSVFYLAAKLLRLVRIPVGRGKGQVTSCSSREPELRIQENVAILLRSSTNGRLLGVPDLTIRLTSAGVVGEHPTEFSKVVQ